jgi:hypothetical protein
MSFQGSLLAVLLFSTMMLGLAPPGAAETSAIHTRAGEAYGRMDCAEARRLLEQLDAAGELDPTELYRLHFAQRATGAVAESNATLERATGALEQSWTREPTLEAGFYLANAYIASNRSEDGQRIAREVTARVASGELPTRTGVEKFQAGKLHADLGDDSAARTLFREALVDLERHPSPETDGHLAWASNWLAERAITARDWSAAEIHLTTYVSHIVPRATDWDRLATVRVRNEMYQEAAAAWNAAVPLDPANADDARYAARLAESAARMGGLPREPRDGGQPFTEMTRAGLETFLGERAARARATRQESEAAAAGGTIPQQQAEELRSRMEAVRGEFVAAALEYALRGHSLRETAFVGGYAPLVFRNAEWQLPGLPEEKPAAATGAKRERAAKAAQEAQAAREAAAGDDDAPDDTGP